uniref:CAB/ELIP/HLIP superfamily protein n=3 Tax=Corallina TaxID=35169 RepID=A0A6M3W9Z8_COROI|nr:CAB/ELIP/HLIP superfamily protein [Corallina officinalis]QJF58596.1 CAB/ELIP/HLIP superfamily protein [Corallina officinalis]QJF58795.1 CAB/ELIP/HLIP superfamily protein [Corallina officinalis]QJF58994.1 CAB/ELIP/HLIP superfamily protein [Corallina officinalis]
MISCIESIINYFNICWTVMYNNLRNQWIWGFTYGAENWNGRLAMLAFMIIFIFEFFTSEPIILLLGF